MILGSILGSPYFGKLPNIKTTISCLAHRRTVTFLGFLLGSLYEASTFLALVIGEESFKPLM